MSYVAYKLIHFAGIFTLIAVLAAASMHAIRGGTRADNPYRRLLGAAQGIAALLVIVGGFGMLARLGLLQEGLPKWAYLKLVIWLALGAALALPYRGRAHARALLIALPVLAVAGGATALLKPF
jgi:hypothetical protein